MSNVYTSNKFDPSLFMGDNRLLSPILRAGSVTLDTDFGEVARAIYVGSSGTLAVLLLDGSTATFANVSAGQWFPVACTQVVTGTTAGIVSTLLWGS